ncbi:MAG: DUF481 domain-containing protein [Thiolinea sp.]
MKKTIIALSVFSALSTISAAQAEVSLFDYAEPTSAYEDAYVYGDLNVNSGNQDQTSYDLSLDLDYERVFSSPSRDIDIDASLSGSASRGGNSGDDSVNTYLGGASASVNNYFVPGSNGAFWYGEGSVGVKKGADDPRVTAVAGLGYGRVVNLTPMAQAIRMGEALRENGQLKGDLSKAEYNQIAQIVAQENAYAARHGADYEQVWIGDMVKVINASGKANGQLSAAGILKARDVLVDERISTRKSGWLVKAGVGAVLRDYDGDSSKAVLDLGAEYHVPLSNQTQFSNEATYSTLLDSSDKSYTFINDMSLTHEVSDRIDWENRWALNFDHDDEADMDTTTNVLSSTYRYYISNKLSFDTTLSLSKVDDDINNNGNDDIDKSLNMGVTYRLK